MKNSEEFYSFICEIGLMILRVAANSMRTCNLAEETEERKVFSMICRQMQFGQVASNSSEHQILSVREVKPALDFTGPLTEWAVAGAGEQGHVMLVSALLHPVIQNLFQDECSIVGLSLSSSFWIQMAFVLRVIGLESHRIKKVGHGSLMPWLVSNWKSKQ